MNTGTSSQVAQGGCKVSILGDVQKRGHDLKGKDSLDKHESLPDECVLNSTFMENTAAE